MSPIADRKTSTPLVISKYKDRRYTLQRSQYDATSKRGLRGLDDIPQLMRCLRCPPTVPLTRGNDAAWRYQRRQGRPKSDRMLSKPISMPLRFKVAYPGWARRLPISWHCPRFEFRTSKDAV